jgi:hypothetical protein
MLTKIAFTFCAAMLAGTAAQADNSKLVIYPSKGQTPEVQKNDEGQCYNWAVSNSGFNPAAPATSAPPPPQGRKVLKGAAVGATVGAVTDNDVGNAALAGAAVGGVAKRSGKRAAAEQQKQMTDAGAAAFHKAQAACLEGRGYTVK